MLKLTIALSFTLLTFLSFGQKTIEAFHIEEKIVIDGIITEESWNRAQVVQDFTQYKPQPGNAASQRTEVRLIYDDNAIYVAAICYDSAELVSKVLSQRDDFNANVDNFQVIIDTYNDDQNGFTFGVSSMGVQSDAKIFVDDQNMNLNMVWSSAVIRNEKGWQLEMRIPYSAFRFPKLEVQNWGINFFRYISRNREESTWCPIKPGFDNWPAQCGEITNLKGIKPPLRLAVMPYLSAYVDHYPLNDPGKSNFSQSFNGGMDIKYGLNEAFTLDMTLVPDFGQVVFDNKVLNLSPFEIQFNENRQFFTEGTELFSKSGLFYSRRIGIQSPYSVLSSNLKADEYLKDVPTSVQLYNASKLSGRTKSGLGIGIFNGLTAEQKATAVNSITGEERSIVSSPLTNFNVLVFDQNLKNNSFVTLTNTNVMREGNFYDANVTGLNTKFNTKDNAYFVSARTAVSNKLYSDETKTGHNWGIVGGKQTGNFIFSGSYYEESDRYDPNDLGFNMNNNKRLIETSVTYRIFKPFWKLNQTSATFSTSYNRLYNPNVYTAMYTSLNIFALTKKFHACGMEVVGSITENYDYFEPRSEGMYYTRPKWMSIGAWISTNYQKRLAIDANAYNVFVDRRNWQEFGFNISPRVRISDKIFLIYQLNQDFVYNVEGYAVPFGEPAQTSEEVIFGLRDQINTTSTINLQYTMTNRMGITFRLRHYRSALSYDSFFDLNEDGSLSPNNSTGLDVNGESVYNTNFNAFTIDFVYRWVFLPGSTIDIVWKNSIFSNDLKINETYFRNLSSMFDYSPLNSFSIKILYWLDYQSLKRKK